MSAEHQITRRQFLRGAIVASVAAAVPKVVKAAIPIEEEARRRFVVRPPNTPTPKPPPAATPAPAETRVAKPVQPPAAEATKAATPEPTIAPTVAPTQEIPSSGEFRVGNLLFRGFSVEDQQYIRDSLGWLQGTGARINFRGQDMAVYDFLQTSPITHVEFVPNLWKPEWTSYIGGFIAFRKDALYGPGLAGGKQRASFLTLLSHGAVHTWQARDLNYTKPDDAKSAELEAEATAVDIAVFRALLPFVGD